MVALSLSVIIFGCVSQVYENLTSMRIPQKMMRKGQPKYYSESEATDHAVSGFDLEQLKGHKQEGMCNKSLLDI